MSMTDALIEQAKNRPDHPAIEDMRAGRVVSLATPNCPGWWIPRRPIFSMLAFGPKISWA